MNKPALLSSAFVTTHASILTLIFACTSYASPEKTNTYVYLGGGNVEFDAPQLGEEPGREFDKPHVTFGVGVQPNQYFAIEGLGRYSGSDIENDNVNDTLRLEYYQIGFSNLLFSPPIFNTPFQLFVQMSVLYTSAELRVKSANFKDETDGMMINVGGGLHLESEDNFWFKAEYIRDAESKGLGDFYNKFDGFQISVGKRL